MGAILDRLDGCKLEQASDEAVWPSAIYSNRSYYSNYSHIMSCEDFAIAGSPGHADHRLVVSVVQICPCPIRRRLVNYVQSHLPLQANAKTS